MTSSPRSIDLYAGQRSKLGNESASVIVRRTTGRPLEDRCAAVYHLMVDDAVAFVAPDQARLDLREQRLKVTRGTKFQAGVGYVGGPLT
jgi:hypothetical protein